MAFSLYFVINMVTSYNNNNIDVITLVKVTGGFDTSIFSRGVNSFTSLA